MKKTFKKLLALTLVSSMFMSFCPISQATQDPNLTYELDFSQLNTTSTSTGDRGLKSAVSPSGVTIDRHYIGSSVPLTKVTKNDVEALYFNGKNGFIVESKDGSAFGSKNLTVEMWIYKEENNSKTGRIFDIRKTFAGAQILEWYYLNAPTVDNGIKITVDGNKKEYKFTDFHNVEQWNHIVITRSFDDADNSAVTKFYSNGELKHTNTSTLSAFETAQSIWVGNYDSSNDIGTALASLKVYNKVFSAEDINAKFEAEKSAYSVNDGGNTGGNEDDNPTTPPTVDPTDPPTDDPEEETKITYELDFSQLNTTSTSTGDRGLKSAVTTSGVTIDRHYINGADPLTKVTKNGVEALCFNGKNGFIVESKDGSAFGSKNFTVEMWIYKEENNSKTGRIFDIRKTFSGAQILEWYYLNAPTVDNGIKITIDGNKKEYKFTDFHNVEQWNHIVITRRFDDADKSAVTKFYSNGDLKHTNTSTLSAFEAAQAIWVGNYDSSNDIGTLMAELRVYNVELSSADILKQFNSTKAKYSGDIPQISAITDTDSTVPDYKTQNITLKFDKDISTFNVGNDNVVITEKATGKKVATTVSSVDTTNKTVTVSIGQMLKPDKEYIVDFISDTENPSEFDPQFSFTVSDYVEKATVTPTKETNNLKVVTGFNDASVGKTCCVLAVVYDETGRMVKTDGTMQKFVVASDNKTCTLNINSTNFVAGYKVKVYAWNMSGLVPMQTISEPVLIEY